jgi:membrane protein YdbS with pleckstrin-like domain
MARMARAGTASLDEDDDAGDTVGHASVIAPLEQVAGLPLVDRPRLSPEDVEVLREYLSTRRQKLARSRLRLIGFAAVVTVILIVIDGQFVLRIIGGAILAFGLIFALLVMADWRRQRVLVEADLREGYLCRYEGVVPATRADHMLVKDGLLRADGGRVQRVDVLPVSRKLYRTNGSLHWTWRQVRD